MIVGDPVERALKLIAMLDGIDVVGQPGRRPLTCLGRLVARDLLDALNALEAERSARRALQARCERQQEILGGAAGRACREARR